MQTHIADAAISVLLAQLDAWGDELRGEAADLEQRQLVLDDIKQRLTATVAEKSAETIKPRGHIFDDEWLTRLMTSLPKDWPEATRLRVARQQLADLRPAIRALIAEEKRLRECLLIIRAAHKAPAEALRRAAYDTVMNCVGADVLEARFAT